MGKFINEMQGTATNNCEISNPPCIPSLFNVLFPDNESWPKKPFLSPWIIPSESIVSFSHFASCFLLVASCSLCLASLLVLQNFVLSLSHLHPLSLSVFCCPASVMYCIVFSILSSLLTRPLLTWPSLSHPYECCHRHSRKERNMFSLRDKSWRSAPKTLRQERRKCRNFFIHLKISHSKTECPSYQRWAGGGVPPSE